MDATALVLYPHQLTQFSVHYRFRAYIVLAVVMTVAFFTVQSATQSIQVIAASKDLGENTVLTPERIKVISIPVSGKLPGMVEG